MRCDAALLSCQNWFLANADNKKKKEKNHILQPAAAAAAGYFPPSSLFLLHCCCLAVNKLQEVGEKNACFCARCSCPGALKVNRNMKRIADTDDAAHEVEANVLLWMIGRSDDDQTEKFTTSN